jgi:hypothetical protein
MMPQRAQAAVNACMPGWPSERCDGLHPVWVCCQLFSASGTGMRQIITAFVLCLSLAACSTTSAVLQAPAAAIAGPYGYVFDNEGGDDLAAIAELDRAIQRTLKDAGLFVPGTGGRRIEVALTHFYLRSDGARFWAGAMAGRDKIISRVRVVEADGAQVASFEVTSTNATAAGSSGGLINRHAEEILAQLK